MKLRVPVTINYTDLSLRIAWIPKYLPLKEFSMSVTKINFTSRLSGSKTQDHFKDSIWYNKLLQVFLAYGSIEFRT